MKISVKQLNGTVLKVDAEGSDTILVLKGNVAAQNADLAVELQKLIYKGKVLKDAQTVGELEFNEENDYMVCMMSKAKAAKPAAGGAAPAAVGASSTGAAPAASTAAATPAAAVSTPAAAAAPALAPAAAPQNFATPEAIANLQAFSGAGPEEATAALNAAMGNADLAFEFLQTGIPDAVPGTPPAGQGLALDALPAPPAGGGGGGLQALRAHPQFNALRQAVQQNPQVLPQILQAIGQQTPELLAAIHADEPGFLEMMNEPVDAAAVAAPPAAPMGQAPAGGMGGEGGMSPQMLMQMLQTLPEEQRNAMMQQLQQLPPDQLAQLMQAAVGQGGMPGGGQGGPPPGAIQVTQEEMASVENLEAMTGSSRIQAVQALRACDGNEALAANMLLDGGMFEDDDEA